MYTLESSLSRKLFEQTEINQLKTLTINRLINVEIRSHRVAAIVLLTDVCVCLDRLLCQSWQLGETTMNLGNWQLKTATLSLSPGVCKYRLQLNLYLRDDIEDSCFRKSLKTLLFSQSSVPSAFEVYLYTTMRYINRRFTYLLTYLLTLICM